MDTYSEDFHFEIMEELSQRSDFSQTKYDFDDITIIPEILSDIESRKEVSPYVDLNGKKYLPLMTAPMDTVVSLNNYHFFDENKILVCFPRGTNIYSHNVSHFSSISLEDAESILNQDPIDFTSEKTGASREFYFCIDMANGHMRKLYKVIYDLSIKRPDIKFIVGNVANPKTYLAFALLPNVWGVRIFIGTGGSCTTAANIGVYYPTASLIDECYKIKKQNGCSAKIIADGGMRKYSDIIKALALGADIVMIGSLFNKMLQSCPETYLYKKIKVKGKFEQWLFKNKYPLYKKFRGMSTKEVQKEWGKKKLTTSEGIVKWNEVLYDLPKWVNNFEDYLKSAMSYTSSSNLTDFKDSEKILISANAYRRFSK